MRQALDELERASLRRGLLQRALVYVAVQVAERDVLPRGQRIPGEVLVNDRDLALPGPGVERAQVDAVDRYFPGGGPNPRPPPGATPPPARRPARRTAADAAE